MLDRQSHDPTGFVVICCFFAFMNQRCSQGGSMTCSLSLLVTMFLWKSSLEATGCTFCEVKSRHCNHVIFSHAGPCFRMRGNDLKKPCFRFSHFHHFDPLCFKLRETFEPTMTAQNNCFQETEQPKSVVKCQGDKQCCGGMCQQKSELCEEEILREEEPSVFVS